jgi:hypothetical protein
MTTDQFSAFARLVNEMRSAQKKYFESRSSTRLSESKRLEARVDQALLNLEAIIKPASPPAEQKNLF